jgi:hypothetical protein
MGDGARYTTWRGLRQVESAEVIGRESALATDQPRQEDEQRRAASEPVDRREMVARGAFPPLVQKSFISFGHTAFPPSPSPAQTSSALYATRL